jgi:hypothetical protein
MEAKDGMMATHLTGDPVCKPITAEQMEGFKKFVRDFWKEIPRRKQIVPPTVGRLRSSLAQEVRG